MLPANGLYGHIRANTFRSAVLLAGFAGLIAAYWWAGCLLWSAAAHLVDFSTPAETMAEAFDQILDDAGRRALAYWQAPLIATAVWYAVATLFYRGLIRAATGAHGVSRRDAPRLYETVERLAIASGLPMPTVEIIDSSALNAYAAGLGPDDATIAVTRGLLDKLEPRELEAVVAHEMVHIRNRDVRLMVIALVFAGGITLLGSLVARAFTFRRTSHWSPGDHEVGGLIGSRHKTGSLGAPALLGVLAAILVAVATMALSHLGAIMTRLAISRSREFLADAGAVELTKDPDALVSALVKISGRDHVPGVPDQMAAMMISQGFDEEDFVEALFSTHPPVAARIRALQAYAGALPPAASRRPPAARAAFAERPSEG